jgi:hypothetical protein
LQAKQSIEIIRVIEVSRSFVQEAALITAERRLLKSKAHFKVWNHVKLYGTEHAKCKSSICTAHIIDDMHTLRHASVCVCACAFVCAFVRVFVYVCVFVCVYANVCVRHKHTTLTWLLSSAEVRDGTLAAPSLFSYRSKYDNKYINKCGVLY